MFAYFMNKENNQYLDCGRSYMNVYMYQMLPFCTYKWYILVILKSHLNKLDLKNIKYI